MCTYPGPGDRPGVGRGWRQAGGRGGTIPGRSGLASGAAHGVAAGNSPAAVRPPRADAAVGARTPSPQEPSAVPAAGGWASGLGNANIGAQQNFANTAFHYADNLTYIHGRHMMKMGGQVLRA